MITPKAVIALKPADITLVLHGTPVTTYPYATYQVLPGRRDRHMGGATETSRVQIDCWAQSAKAAAELMDAITAAYDEQHTTIDGTPVTFLRNSSPSILKQSQETWRATTDFVVVIG